MRIIDKMHDFYDYLGSPTDTLVFDRRGSYLLTKEMVCNMMDSGVRYIHGHRIEDIPYRYMILQCGATYWLFLITITERKKPMWETTEKVTNYTMELLTTWKNFNKPRKLLNISLITPKSWYRDIDTIRKHVNDIKNFVDTNDYKVVWDFNNRNPFFSNPTDTYPILTACGINQCVDPVELFSAIEEHFSLKKTEAERTEPIGATNNDKIVMHGFDTKISFRGK